MKTTVFEAQALSLYKRLKRKSSLKPSVDTNNLFSSLVKLALSVEANTYQEFPPSVQAILPDIHTLASHGEYELEQYWAKRIIASPFPAIELEQYPYYHNYEQLTQLEYQSLRVLGERRITRVLFVGSGPLPLSAILLARTFGVRVTCLDKDEDAVRLSGKLIEKLGLSHVIEVAHKDILSTITLAEYDVVFLGALVGMTEQEKLDVINHLYTHVRPGALIVIRTAHQGRRLLYPFFDERKISNFALHAVIEPKNEVVNSIILAEKTVAGLGTITIHDKSFTQVFKDFRSFSLNHIQEQYKLQYNPLWHHDIDRAEQVYNQSNTNLFVAYAGERIVGTIAIRPFDLKHKDLQQRYQGKHVGAIWRFFIDPEYMHTELVQMLHDKVEQFARHHKYNLLYAHDQIFVPGAITKYIKQEYKPILEEHDQWGTIHLENKL